MRAAAVKNHLVNNRSGGFEMFCKYNKINYKWIIWLVSAVAAIVAAVTAFLIIKEKKKKDEEQLEEYLDYSIQ